MGEYLSCVDFSKLCHVIKYFPGLNKNLVKKILLSLSIQVQDTLNGEINTLFNLNHMSIKWVKSCTITSHSIKYISRIPSF